MTLSVTTSFPTLTGILSGHTSQDPHDDVFYLFLQKKKIVASFPSSSYYPLLRVCQNLRFLRGLGQRGKAAPAARTARVCWRTPLRLSAAGGLPIGVRGAGVSEPFVLFCWLRRCMAKHHMTCAPRRRRTRARCPDVRARRRACLPLTD